MSDPKRSAGLTRSVAALIGGLAAASALAAGHLVAGLTDPRFSPLIVVGNAAIDLTPQPVKSFAIDVFGAADKLALLIGMALVILVVAVVGGVLSRRRRLPGMLMIALFGVVGTSAAVGLGPTALIAPVVTTVAGGGVFGWLHSTAGRRGETSEETEPARSGPDRRRFLGSAATVAVGAGAAGLGGRHLVERDNVRASRLAVERALSVRPVESSKIPAGADFHEVGTPTFLTPNEEFHRIDTAFTVPRVTVEGWRLRVHGMVDRELNLSFDDLLRRRRIARTITMSCVSNPVGGDYVSTATFEGVPIRDVLLEAGVRSGADQVFSTSTDGFTAGTPVDVLTDPGRDALLAVGMNGRPLPAQHGFPVRMVTPGLYGFVSATKWLTGLELTTWDGETYWEKRGWAERAPVKTQSRIDSPAGFARVPAGTTTVAGTSWAQTTGIRRVQVRLDGGPWQDARLSTEVNLDTWRMWRTELDLSPGRHTLECRATDKSGYTQTPKRADVVPDGATGWHSVSVTAE
ncbi:DMSO/TMAO reductase YedYZ molybdopterin-dependent catalytic subunit [Saccharopolyspora lacisalsi]|uniref:DMSO/TMAO reductase YedYZ molybdopterin-dependent catalytic subunit n=1 Tax=Halosaccharopolyspora lacisalsi TaxID=1000566 RepID=A0A839DUJ0_9PSEU|nr:molybdopterin-dependent oxidoreductase [Halosaccharopolyspora lacisalsi]MBA8824580.1 DMSO/TMAO reductase YedYZ molybdopterin-dependent catalytic subunit [Halosaccharopolyspora lacisalsi]